mmetsp:Transcript_47656/g.123645  ORF Transcript_47656/g.123645 Transcript_47656/m.123645 type:complete len:201 (+) Transcript_47656:349-951(+)
MTCSSEPALAKHHAQSSVSTLPPRVPSSSVESPTATVSPVGLKLTFTSFFVAGLSSLKVICTSSPCWLHVYPSSAFSAASSTGCCVDDVEGLDLASGAELRPLPLPLLPRSDSMSRSPRPDRPAGMPLSSPSEGKFWSHFSKKASLSGLPASPSGGVLPSLANSCRSSSVGAFCNSCCNASYRLATACARETPPLWAIAS